MIPPLTSRHRYGQSPPGYRDVQEAVNYFEVNWGHKTALMRDVLSTGATVGSFIDYLCTKLNDKVARLSTRGTKRANHLIRVYIKIHCEIHDPLFRKYVTGRMDLS